MYEYVFDSSVDCPVSTTSLTILVFKGCEIECTDRSGDLLGVFHEKADYLRDAIIKEYDYQKSHEGLSADEAIVVVSKHVIEKVLPYMFENMQ